MVVYGNPQFRTSLRIMVMQLRVRLERLASNDLERWREFLIQAGQLEQAVADDCGGAREHLQHFEALTDCAAEVFVGAVANGSVLDRGRQLLDKAIAFQDCKLSVKVPEGFEFYALYPEQYRQSALRWSEDHKADRGCGVLVVGIRSIGTSLSAVVASTLRMSGWPARRLTVRPAGHPFQRKVQLPDVGPARFGIVVDEGPGLSGSSMAAVAEALLQPGFSHEQIAIFPGNSNSPGPAASEQVRALWKAIPRYFQPMSSPFPAADDLSGGRWRAFAYDDKSAWPAIAPAFERAKYLGRHDGKRGLWKFSGLGSLVNESQTAIERIVQSGWSIPMVGKAQGFFAMPWIAGRRLTQYDATNHALLAKIGRYVAESADVGLDVAEHEAAIERLAHMLYWNTRECVGEQLAERTRSLAVAARHFHVPYTYGDGRMAPYEWIETADGLLKKADHSGHDCDHTVIGRQSILWDIAGTMIEWQLGTREVKVLFEAITRGDKNFHLAALPFYCAAYAAFKVGLMTFALENCPESEVKRIERARDRFRGQLANVLASHSRSCQ